MQTLEESFVMRVQELVEALKYAFREDIPTFPGLVLLYASMDFISSLSRPIGQADTTRSVFKNWVRTYMLPDSKLACNEDDIYAARCGLVHTLSLSSLASREGNAREISYINREDGVKRLQELCDKKGHNVIVVSVYEYTHAFFEGIRRFLEAITKNTTLCDTVFHHMSGVASSISFTARDSA
jgi:hypothetical protein